MLEPSIFASPLIRSPVLTILALVTMKGTNMDYLDIVNLVQFGFGMETWPAYIALFLNRVALGLFFTFSGYHKLFNKERHATFVATLASCHVPLLGFNQWFVPSVEFMGGLALVSGVASPLACLGLICVCLVAVCTDGLKRVVSYVPIDRADYVDDVLYLPEVLYIIGLAIVLTIGPGPFTLVTVVGY
jgi:putative oxidoreductase